MSELTPEERDRIYEEERVRAEARAYYAKHGGSPAPEPPSAPPNHDKTTPLVTCGLILVAICLSMAGIGTCHREQGAGDPIADSVSDVDAITMAHEFVTKRLKAPGTAEFSSSPEEVVTKIGDAPPTYRVTGWVDSQNSFGAKLRSTFAVKLHYTGHSEWNADDVQVVGTE